MDETLGFLLFALKKQKALPFWGPAYTAHLEVDYKSVWSLHCSLEPLHLFTRSVAGVAKLLT